MTRNILLILLVPFFVHGQSAFISGNDTICENSQFEANISVAFSGVAPFTFVYAINGINEPAITTTINPHIINTKKSGSYTLTSYSDANGFGPVSGTGLVTVLESPVSIIHLESDTLSLINTTANFFSQSTGNIISWNWSFGDNTANVFSENVTHVYDTTIAIYQASLIVTDINGCSDTAITNIFIRDKYWIYIPNSFTPDGDQFSPNEKFCIEYHGIRESTFLLKVFNSQGDLIFQSINPSELKCSKSGGWNGQYFDEISARYTDLPLGTYVYDIYFQDFEGWKHQEYGVINLIK